ncbi:MAG TPA: hypothetical protein PLF21_02290 [Exilispira sp.]|nr:hypothetical protein [Exilispira sp.]
MKTLEELERLSKILEHNQLPASKINWSGAHVNITNTEPSEDETKTFFFRSIYVITQFSHELSWLFEKIRDAFYAEDRIDYLIKDDFFGRLANAANRCIENNSELTAHILYAAVLHEAFAIYDDMENKKFLILPIAPDSAIFDDFVDDQSRENGYVSNEKTIDFFKKKGVNIYGY